MVLNYLQDKKYVYKRLINCTQTPYRYRRVNTSWRFFSIQDWYPLVHTGRNSTWCLLTDGKGQMHGWRLLSTQAAKPAKSTLPTE
jgi:hypothetical protein